MSVTQSELFEAMRAATGLTEDRYDQAGWTDRHRSWITGDRDDGLLRGGGAVGLSLGNRGPIRFTANGALHPEILEAYSRHGLTACMCSRAC